METRVLVRRREGRTIKNTIEPGEGRAESYPHKGADGEKEEH